MFDDIHCKSKLLVTVRFYLVCSSISERANFVKNRRTSRGKNPFCNQIIDFLQQIPSLGIFLFANSFKQCAETYRSQNW